MDCPVCNHKGLKADTTACPSCGADLTAYHSLDRIAGSLRRQRKLSMIFIVLFVIAVAAALLILLFAGSPGTSAEDKQKLANQETAMALLTAENQQLKVNNAELLARQAALIAEKEAAALREIRHVIKEGETLYDIAKKYLGDGGLYTKIAADNGIGNPDIIITGKEIVINQ